MPTQKLSRDPLAQLAAARRADAKRLARRVRCLGLDPEHTFVSAHPTRERICEQCRRAIDAQLRGLSPRLYRKMVVPPAD